MPLFLNEETSPVFFDRSAAKLLQPPGFASSQTGDDTAAQRIAPSPAGGKIVGSIPILRPLGVEFECSPLDLAGFSPGSPTSSHGPNASTWQLSVVRRCVCVNECGRLLVSVFASR